MSKNLFFVILAASLTSCATQRFHFTNNVYGTQMPNYEQSQTFFLSGVGQTTDVNVAEVCGSASKVLRVETTDSPLDVVLGAVTWGIYTPRTAKVTCLK
mgnify:CR=1 FL=1